MEVTLLRASAEAPLWFLEMFAMGVRESLQIDIWLSRIADLDIAWVFSDLR